MFFVVLPHELLTSWSEIAANGDAGPGSRQIWGRWIDGDDVLRISLAGETGAQPVGLWVTSAELAERSDWARHQLGALPVLIAFDPTSDRLTAYRNADDTLVEAPVEVVRLVSDYHKRHQGLFDVGYLNDRTVTIVGVGTGGSLVAEQLARCGVGRLRLIDFDRLEVHNIARHVCDLSDLGRLKVSALADLLTRISPVIQVEPINCNVLDRPDLLIEAIDGSDLVVAATDSEAAKLKINEECWVRGVPVVYGAAYTRGFGGDVFRAVPPEGACYSCFQSHVAEMFEMAPKASEIDYATIEDPTRFVAEPGLGMDVTFVALLLSKLALLTLLRQSPSTITDWPANWVMWGNQQEWIFEHPLQSIFVDLPRVPACPVCDRTAYLSSNLGPMSSEEIADEAAALIEAAMAAGREPNAPTLPILGARLAGDSGPDAAASATDAESESRG